MRTPAARLAYSIAAAVVYVAGPNTASDGALSLSKKVSPFLTPNLERTIVTDSCLEHRNYACMGQSRQRVFPANARLIGATPLRVAVSATLTENMTRHLQVAPSRTASAVPPATKYRPKFTGYTNASHASVACSRYSRHPLLGTSKTVMPHL